MRKQNLSWDVKGCGDAGCFTNYSHLKLKDIVNRSCLNFWRSSVLKIRFIPDLWHCKHCIYPVFCIGTLSRSLLYGFFHPIHRLLQLRMPAGVHVCSAHPKSQQPHLAMIHIFREAIPQRFAHLWTCVLMRF